MIRSRYQSKIISKLAERQKKKKKKNYTELGSSLKGERRKKESDIKRQTQKLLARRPNREEMTEQTGYPWYEDEKKRQYGFHENCADEIS